MKFELQDFREIFFDKNERKNWCLETNTFNYLLIFYTNKKFEVKAQIRRSLRIFHFVKVLYLLTSVNSNLIYIFFSESGIRKLR